MNSIILSTSEVRAIRKNRKTRIIRNNKLHYCPGDILWVKEAFFPIKIRGVKNIKYIYKSDGIKNNDGTPIKWRSPMLMPKEVARTFLLIESIRLLMPKEATRAFLLTGEKRVWEYKFRAIPGRWQV